MNIASVNGIAIAYHDEGDGQPLLLVHAFPLSSAMWTRQIAGFAPRCRVIAPDLRGFGDTARGAGASSLDEFADDLAGLLDHLGIARAVVMGLSMGGYVSFAFWRRHRDRVAGLVLADTKAGADSEAGKQTREQNARLVESLGPGALADQLLPNLLGPSATTPARDEARALIVTNDRAGIAAALRAMAARPDSTDLLATIDVPTLVLYGVEDAITPPDESRALHAAIPGSQLAEIPGAGHLSNLENPEAFNAAVSAFLSHDPQRFAGGEPGGELNAGGGLAGGW